MSRHFSLPSAFLAVALTTPVALADEGANSPRNGPALAKSESRAAVAEASPHREVEASFVSLLSEKGLTGWIVHEGLPRAWERDGEMISCVSAGGGWLRTENLYSDFELQLEYRLTPGANTGIGIRAPETGNPTSAGIEIQLIDDEAEKYRDLRPDQRTGSVYYQVAATKKAPVRPTGEWNRVEIRCLGDRLTVAINGEQVNDVDLVRSSAATAGEGAKPYQLSQRPPIGHIALQGYSSRVDFRNIRVRDLAVSTPTGLRYVDLSAGSGEPVDGGDLVTIHYVGQLTSGKRFTDTRDLGDAVEVPLEKVIPGLQEGIGGMKVGGKRRLIVPPALGYGGAGVENVIPPAATLVFEVELCGVRR